VTGFITGMYVVATPVFAALILRSRIGLQTWAAVVLAMAGLGVLTLSGFSIGYGEALIFVAALLYALHIVGLGAWSDAQQAIGMAIVQLMVITVICTLGTAPNGIVLPDRLGDWASLLYMAVFAAAGAMIGQTWAQAHLPATRAAIIMSTEPVFAALFAVLLGGESATVRMVFGGLLVLAAMLLAELAPRRKVEAEVTHLTV
jgi:drug/metabolite transporter (DMT)-like permease